MILGRARNDLPLPLVGSSRDAHDEDQSRAAASRQQLRQEQSQPLLTAFLAQLEMWRRDALPRSPLGQAVQYALNQWSALTRYVEDGRLPIDNNASERDLRGVAVGRRNWLFCGSNRGGRTAAMIASVIATCQRNRVEPFAWLRDTLTLLPQIPRDGHGQIPAEQLLSLLPTGNR